MAISNLYAQSETLSKTPVSQLDFPGHEDTLPRTKIYHGMDVCVYWNNNAYRIGRLQSWAPQARTRQAVHKYEINSSTFGRPVDLIPGRAEGYSISASKIEVWGQEVERALGLATATSGQSALFADLMDMRWPITLYEYLYRGDGKLYTMWQYPSCWITSHGDAEVSAEGDGIMMANLEIMHLPRILVEYNAGSLVTVNS